MFTQGGNTQYTDMTNEDIVQMQKEQENRLIGSMMVQSVFLALALMLYESWSWGKFDQVWQSALLYGMLAFCFQASLYLLYRTMFEDSTNYRRNIKRMKNKNKRRMAQIKYEVDKQRTEWMLDQQIQQFQSNAMMAQADCHTWSNLPHDQLSYNISAKARKTDWTIIDPISLFSCSFCI